MRVIALLIIAVSLAGCKSKSGSTCPACPTTAPAQALAPERDDAIVASALVFSPPIAAGEQPLDLARGPRQASAFVGYDQLTTTFSFTQTVDQQGLLNWANGDRFNRRSVSTRVGVSTR